MNIFREEPKTLQEKIDRARTMKDRPALIRLLREREALKKSAPVVKSRKGCDNTTDIFSGVTLNKISKVVVISQNGKNWCFDLVGLARYLFTSQSNPYTRQPFEAADVKRVLLLAALEPQIIVQREQIKEHTIKYTDLKYSQCEQELMNDLIAFNNQTLDVLRRGNPDYLYILYLIYNNVYTKIPLNLNSCRAGRYPRRVLVAARDLLDFILTIFPYEVSTGDY